MFCPRCGNTVQEESQFCPKCGLGLRATTPAQALASGDVTELDIVREALTTEYEILDELGRGGMAIVYRGRDRQLEREVAIKVLPFSLAFDAEFVERFQREARTAAQLEHPNIIPIYRVGKAGRVIYFVMKLLRGASLSQILVERKQLPLAEIRRLLVETGSALGHAAKSGIVHRDIKPDNIMFDDHGACVVTDFGIAKAASGQKLTGTGMSIGTPHYMSPEQARAQTIDGRSDIYSLGVVAYQCLVGQVPYDGEDSFSIGYKHIMEPIPTPTLGSAEERRLYEIIRKMIMKDPRDRFQDADELIRVLEGQPTQAPVTPSRPSRATAARTGLADKPTTPIPSLTIDRPSTSGRRPVGRRSVAQQESAGSGIWLWIFLALILGGGFGGYYLVSKPSRSAIVPDSTVTDSSRSQLNDSAAIRDSSGGFLHGTTHDSSQAAAPVQPSANRDSTHPPGPLPVAAAAAGSDSGSLRITGLPPGSSVIVDDKPVFDALIRLSVGSHLLGISAPNYQFYQDTIIVANGDVIELSPELVRFGSPTHPEPLRIAAAVPCDLPNLANRFGRACYDDPPRPITSTRVPLTPGIEGTPSPSVFLVKVSADGKTQRVQSRTPSGDPAFQKLATAFVARMEWKPAMKAGVTLAGWTQLVVVPDQ